VGSARPSGKTQGEKPLYSFLPIIDSRMAGKDGVSCYKVIEREYIEPIKMCQNAPMVLLVLRVERKY